MKTKKHVVALACAASIAVAGAATMAEAGPMHAPMHAHMHSGPMHGGPGPGAYHVAHMHGPGHWHGRHRGWGFGAYPVFYGGYYDYGGYYGGGCGWLHRRAVVTGSPYWWSRYETCIGR